MAQTNKIFSAMGSLLVWTSATTWKIYSVIPAFWLYNFAPFKTRRAKCFFVRSVGSEIKFGT